MTEGESSSKDEAYSGRSLMYRYTFIVAMSSFAMGYGVSSITPAILYIPSSIPLSTLCTTLLVSIVLVGALIGTFVSGFIADRFGRWWVFVGCNLVGIIASIGSALGMNAWSLIIWRFIIGLAIGSASVVTGLFLAETSPPGKRGQLQGYGNLAGWIGGIVAHLVGIILIYSTSEYMSWRLMFLIAILFYLPAMLFTIFMLPESPRWLIVHQNNEVEATRVLKTIYIEQDALQVELENMRTSARLNEHESRFIDIFKSEYRKTMIMVFSLQILQQLSGNNVIVFLSSIILNEMGFDRERAVVLTGASVIPQVLIIWFIVHNLDSIGRKGPLLTSMVGSILSLIILALVCDKTNTSSAIIWLSVVGIMLNRIFYSVGLAPLPTVVCAEILPSSIRGRALSSAMAIGEVIKIISVASYLPLTRVISPAYIYAFLIISMFIGVIYVGGQLRETKGQPLDVLKVDEKGNTAVLQLHGDIHKT